MILQLEPLPGDVAHLLLRGATQLEPSAHTRQRLRERLAAETHKSGSSRTVLVAPGGGVSSWVARAARSRLVIALSGFAVGAGAMASLPLTRVATVPGPTIVAAPQNEVVVASLPIEVPAAQTVVPQSSPIAPIREKARVVRAVAERRAIQGAPIPTEPGPPPRRLIPDSPLRSEGDLLERGRIALVRGDADGALEAVDEHASRFARGALTEEREVLRIQALSSAERGPEARVALAAFVRARPQSLSRPALEALIGH